MKTIGLIGGMSWESTVPYYAIINGYVKGYAGEMHELLLPVCREYGEERSF